MIDYKMGSFGVLNIDDMENQPLFLLDGGIENRYKEKYEFLNDERQEYHGYLFQYTLEGKGIFEKNNVYNEIEEGEGFFVRFPEKSKYYIEKDSELNWKFIYLHFDGAAAIPFLNKISELAYYKFKLDVNSLPIIMAMKFQNKMMNGERLQKYEGGEFLYKFLCAVLREIESPSINNINNIVKKAEDIMDVEYASIEGIESIASRLGISIEHFIRVFKAEKSITPIKYLTNLRIQSAMNELLNTDEKLDIIANRNGFSNGNYFCKVFRKYIGMSPTEYRNSRR